MEYLIPGDFLAPSPYTCVFSSPLAMNFVHNVRIKLMMRTSIWPRSKESANCMLGDVHTPRPSAVCVFAAPRKKTCERGSVLGGLLFYVRFYTFSAKEERSSRPPNSKCHSRIKRCCRCPRQQKTKWEFHGFGFSFDFCLKL